MTKALASFLAVCLLALAAVGVLARQQAVEIGRLRTANQTATEALDRAAKQRQKDLATIALWQRSNAATARQFAAAQEGLQKALQAHAGWSEADVPADVQKALQRAAEAPQ
jgi:hypothetical protein